ncbi:Integrase/recombinase, phage associated [Streptococcus sp. DD13]|nr:Integrase/recombinase, phage associated [Streptococcus sp. DD13]
MIALPILSFFRSLFPLYLLFSVENPNKKFSHLSKENAKKAVSFFETALGNL